MIINLYFEIAWPMKSPITVSCCRYWFRISNLVYVYITIMFIFFGVGFVYFFFNVSIFLDCQVNRNLLSIFQICLIFSVTLTLWMDLSTKKMIFNHIISEEKNSELCESLETITGLLSRLMSMEVNQLIWYSIFFAKPVDVFDYWSQLKNCPDNLRKVLQSFFAGVV